MEDFHNFIVDLTKNSTAQSILQQDVQAVFDIIMKDCKKNIQLAAQRGLNYAYLCIYEPGARYKGMIPIDALIRMNSVMRTKLEEFRIDPVMSKLRKQLHPFRVESKVLAESDLKKEYLPDPARVVDSIIRDPESSSGQLIGIVVSWG